MIFKLLEGFATVKAKRNTYDRASHVGGIRKTTYLRKSNSFKPRLLLIITKKESLESFLIFYYFFFLKVKIDNLRQIYCGCIEENTPQLISFSLYVRLVHMEIFLL